MLGGVHFRGWERGGDVAVSLFLVYPVFCFEVMFVLALHMLWPDTLLICQGPFTGVSVCVWEFIFFEYLIAKTILIQIRLF